MLSATAWHQAGHSRGGQEGMREGVPRYYVLPRGVPPSWTSMVLFFIVQEQAGMHFFQGFLILN